MAPLGALVVFLSFFTASEAFFSSATLELDQEIAIKTLDHAIITKIGLLRCMVEFFKDNPQYIDQEMATKFEDLQRNTITADKPGELQSLFSVIMPRMRLQNAIAEIQSSNAEINSAPLKNMAAAHFSGEQFKEGSKRLLELKSQIITSLLKGVKFEHARQLSGQYLHTLQDFYSRSNWVELGNRLRNFAPLTNPANPILSEFIAKPNEATCISCPEQNDNCDNNLIIQKITSGYYGGQDISKPKNVSKCSHGGILDSSRYHGASGGINKESTSRIWSPHYKLHTVAAEHAIEATKQFFVDLRTTVGDDKFARFLNLQALRTLALVIDDTGSMGEEIKSVKKLSTDFVQNTKSPMGNTAFVYILVPFNDPSVGPVTVTSSPDEVLDAVNSLKAHKGGDCPELGMTGLYQALLQSVQDSVIYFFSDADAKDLNLAQVVLILAKQKKVKINFILSGQCSYRRKRRDAHLGSQSLYQSLAAATGGQVLKTKKNKVSVLVDIIGSKSSGGDSADLNEVILLDVRSDSKEEVQDMQFSIDVDSSLVDVLIVLSADADPAITLLNPTEDNPLKATYHIQFDHIHVTEVESFEGGPLRIRVRCTGPYSLQVTGRSALDFTYQLSSVENPETGETRRLLGSPVKGQTLLLTLAFTKPELIKELTSLSLLNSNGTVMESFSVEKGQGIHSGSFHVLFTPHSERFRFQLTGKTTDGKNLRRVKPTEIKMEDVQLDFNYGLVNNSRTVFPGITKKISLKITNKGNSQNFTLKAMDDLGFVQSLEPNYQFVTVNETVELSLIVSAPANANVGETSTVAVYATPISSDKTSNYMVFYVSVITKEDDNSPPKCEVHNQTTMCDAVYNLPKCSNTTWTSKTDITDHGKGLLTITAKNSNIGQLTVAPFTAGISNKSVRAVYTSTCCHPTASIITVDKLGNTAVCELSAVTQVVNIKANAKYSTLNVTLGETSKLEFNITNMGTKSSFTLQLSESKYYTGYVTPLKFELDHGELVRCEVVLIGQRETGSNNTRLVVEAVLLETEMIAELDMPILELDITVQTRREEERPEPSLGWNITADLDPKPPLIIQYGVKAVINFTVINNGLAGIFYFKSSPSNLISTRFTPNPVSLNNSQTTLIEMEIDAKENRVQEGKMLVNATSHRNLSNKEIILFSRNVKVIQKTAHENKFHALKSLVPNGKVVISAGATVRVNFTVINVGKDGQFNFKVSCPNSLKCNVDPGKAFLKQNERILGHLTVKSTTTTESGNMQVKVTAVSTSAKSEKTEHDIFTLEIVVNNNIAVEEIKEEEKIGFITIIGIVVGCVLLLALLLLLIVLCLRKRGSWNLWKSKSNPKKERVKVEISSQDTGGDKPEMV